MEFDLKVEVDEAKGVLRVNGVPYRVQEDQPHEKVVRSPRDRRGGPENDRRHPKQVLALALKQAGTLSAIRAVLLKAGIAEPEANYAEAIKQALAARCHFCLTDRGPTHGANGLVSDRAYWVAEGDMLIRIARRFGIPQDRLELANWPDLRDPNRLWVGQSLRIPTQVTP